MSSTPLYDDLSVDYDRFVNWQERLKYEMPLIERLLQSSGANRILDVACGTGMHALALAGHGFQVAGVDISEGMIQKARTNAAAAGLDIPFTVAGFGRLADAVKTKYEALLCLGNSLPHVVTKTEMAATLDDFAAVLQPGGMLIIQNRNFDNVMIKQNRWMEPQSWQETGKEWVFIRFYDFNPDGGITFNVLTLYKDNQKGAWSQNIQSSTLWPWRHFELVQILETAGFSSIQSFGDMNASPFHPESSSNCILTAVLS